MYKCNNKETISFAKITQERSWLWSKECWVSNQLPIKEYNYVLGDTTGTLGTSDYASKGGSVGGVHICRTPDIVHANPKSHFNKDPRTYQALRLVARSTDLPPACSSGVWSQGPPPT